jgi:hypothetical protein
LKLYSFHNIKDIVNDKIFKRIDHRILVYLVFVGISTVFWFLNELNNTYNSTINYPIKFTHIPKTKSLVNDLPEYLQLSVNTDGYTLLRYKFGPKVFPIVVNLEKHTNINIINNPNVKQFQLQTRYLRRSINKQLQNNIEIVDIFPDTILFQFSNIVSKRVVVKSNVELGFTEECFLDGEITFIPDSITVTGPDIILDTLRAIYTKFKVFDKLNKPVKEFITLQKQNKLKYSNKNVEIVIPSTKFTQLQFEVDINTVNVPDTLLLKTFPEKVKVSCMVSLADYNNIKASDFVIDVDYADIEHLLGDKLFLNMRITPHKVRSVSYSPEQVEFIIDKKQ